MSATVSIRIGAVRAGDYGGQRSHDMRKGKKLDYVDYDKTYLNTGDDVPTLFAVHRMNEDQKEAARIAAKEQLYTALLIDDEATEEAARAAVKACRQGYKRDGVVAYRGILTYGRDAQAILEGISSEEQDRLALEAIVKAADVLKTVPFGVKAHRDESALHYHYYLLATDERGAKLHPKKADCSAMQTAAAIPYHHLGIKRGKKIGDWIKEGNGGKTIHRTVQELHKDLPLEISAKQKELECLQEKIEAQQLVLQEIIEKYQAEIAFFSTQWESFGQQMLALEEEKKYIAEQKNVLHEQSIKIEEQKKGLEEQKIILENQKENASNNLKSIADKIKDKENQITLMDDLLNDFDSFKEQFLPEESEQFAKEKQSELKAEIEFNRQMRNQPRVK